jgi:hypothetical protein
MAIRIVAIDFQEGPLPAVVSDRQRNGVLLMAENVNLQNTRRGVFSLTDFSYVAGLRAFGTVGDFKFNRVTLFKGFEPFPLNGGVVDKDVLATFNFDKPKTLSVIEPFYSSCH